MILPLTAIGQALLLSALLMIPGMGTVDFCLAKSQVCHEAKVKACCCRHKEPKEDRVPCCITVHQDWMVPTKEVAKIAPLLGPGLLKRWADTAVIPVAPVTAVKVGRVALEPPPPLRDRFLAMIQVRLV